MLWIAGEPRLTAAEEKDMGVDPVSTSCIVTLVAGFSSNWQCYVLRTRRTLAVVSDNAAVDPRLRSDMSFRLLTAERAALSGLEIRLYSPSEIIAGFISGPHLDSRPSLATRCDAQAAAECGLLAIQLSNHIQHQHLARRGPSAHIGRSLEPIFTGLRHDLILDPDFNLNRIDGPFCDRITY